MTQNMFMSSDHLPCDQRLFFGELEKGETILIFDKTTFGMADMAVAAGFFQSKTQARKNGWDGPVPLGFGQKKCGKKFVHWFNSMDTIS